ncbi:deazaflavin-dependent oxidoreductase (nitroreductase family) [Agromyces terreus]|uniref:Deazaflavin-dependent oxidoreductase (Nitroreductase family) n=1 Tax=Agromyces terreus TaxID=424795 RepID=A0A9X2GW35_9MICO|nr:nitroreductase/quinone reductase family protein [Agromyces terreus]MCP2369727.1 deazaflavin-dependent oxidoreductase (nitroreductase family) [Agromyces terreus]
MTETDDEVVAAFRAGRTPPGMHADRLLLLTTTGRRSGDRHTSPLMRLPLPDADHVVASANASPRHPQWFRNLQVDPLVHVEVLGEEYDAVAQVLTHDEHDSAWDWILQFAPFFAEHQAGVDRTIPVVRLDRARPGEPAQGAR